MSKEEQLQKRINEVIYGENRKKRVTLGMLLLAIDMSYQNVDFASFPQKKFRYTYENGDLVFRSYEDSDTFVGWYTRNKLLEEATLSDQSEDTVDCLYYLLCT